MQPVSCTSRLFHDAKNCLASNRGFQSERLVPCKSHAPLPRCLATRRHRDAFAGIPSELSCDSVRIDPTCGPEACTPGERGLSGAVRAGHNMERWHGQIHCRMGSSGSSIGRLDDPISVLGPSDVGAVLTKTVEGTTRLDLSCEIGSHPIPPSVSPNGFLSSPHLDET